MRAELLELSKEHSSLTAKKEEILSNIATLQKQAEESSNALYEKGYELANEKMSQAAETMSHKYREMEESFKKDYLNTLEECASSFQQQIADKQAELAEVDAQLIDLTSKLTSAVEAAKRAEELRIKQDFYRL